MLESLFNKVAGPQACNFIKKRLQHKCFPVKFAKILGKSILKNTFCDCFCFSFSKTSLSNKDGCCKKSLKVNTPLQGKTTTES